MTSPAPQHKSVLIYIIFDDIMNAQKKRRPRMPDTIIQYNDRIKLVWNGRLWTVWKNGRAVAYDIDKGRALEYAHRYSMYPED
jgi:hypothetical protein